jgi:hypothetical protein
MTRLAMDRYGPNAPERRPASDRLVIMAKQVLEVRECDRCGKEPAHTWTITGPEGAVREIELCERHGAAVANAYALGRAMSRPTVRRRPRRCESTPTADSRLAAAPGQPEPTWR